jgi:hypothetical protein
MSCVCLASHACTECAQGANVAKLMLQLMKETARLCYTTTRCVTNTPSAGTLPGLWPHSRRRAIAQHHRRHRRNAAASPRRCGWRHHLQRCLHTASRRRRRCPLPLTGNLAAFAHSQAYASACCLPAVASSVTPIPSHAFLPRCLSSSLLFSTCVADNSTAILMISNVQIQVSSLTWHASRPSRRKCSSCSQRIQCVQLQYGGNDCTTIPTPHLLPRHAEFAVLVGIAIGLDRRE